MLSPLGRGAFSTVLKVRDREDENEYALKLIPAREDGRARREVDIALEVQHPHLLNTFDGGVEGELVWLQLELAHGTLKDTIRSGSRLPETWQALCEVAVGLWALHEAGIIHRDLKPSNVLLTAEGAKLGDLGLARGSGRARLTNQGMILGTPGYMSPEQARGEAVTEASDVFSLAVLFYEAIEGRLPYDDAEPMRMVVDVGQGRIRPFRRAEDALDPEIVDLLRQALEPDPAARPQSLVGLVDFPPGRLPSDDFPVFADEDPETVVTGGKVRDDPTWRVRKRARDQVKAEAAEVERQDRRTVLALQLVVFLLLGLVALRGLSRFL